MTSAAEYTYLQSPVWACRCSSLLYTYVHHISLSCLRQRCAFWHAAIKGVSVCRTLHHMMQTFILNNQPPMLQRQKQSGTLYKHQHICCECFRCCSTLNSTAARSLMSFKCTGIFSQRTSKSPGAAARTTGADSPLSFVGAIVGGCVLGLGV